MNANEKKMITMILGAIFVIFVLAGVIKSFNAPTVEFGSPDKTEPAITTQAPPVTETVEPPKVVADAEMTAKFKTYLSDNFSETSWYRYINDVTVLTSGTAIIDTSMFAKDSNKEIAENMANGALLWGGGDIETVRINASDGLPLFSKNK